MEVRECVMVLSMFPFVHVMKDYGFIKIGKDLIWVREASTWKAWLKEGSQQCRWHWKLTPWHGDRSTNWLKKDRSFIRLADWKTWMLKRTFGEGQMTRTSYEGSSAVCGIIIISVVKVKWYKFYLKQKRGRCTGISIQQHGCSGKGSHPKTF